MEKVQLNRIPLEEILPNSVEYFWLHLPYAIPGFLTFFIGLLICVFCLKVFLEKNRNTDYLSFSVFFFSFSILSLILSIRSVIQSKDLILEFQLFTYWTVFFTVPGLTELFYIATHKRFKVFRIVNLFLIFYAFYCVYLLLTDQAFSGEWFQYPFGLYPVTTLPIKLWGILCLALFLLVCVPGIFIHFSKPKNKDPNKLLIAGGILTSLLISSNVPSMSGIEIYPLGLFNFVPMLIIGYAIFKSNFFDLRTLIFDKKFGFYSIASLFSFLLVGIVFLISTFYKPEYFDRDIYNPYLLIPLVSLFFIILLATYLSGSNPSNSLNLHVSGVILCYGLLQILGVFRAIDLEPLVSLRLEQILYLFFVALPLLNLRLLFLVLESKNNWRVHLITFLTFVYMLLSQTPYFFDGFYNYSFGRMPNSGIGMKLFIITSIFSLLFVILEWKKIKDENKNKSKSIFFYTFIFSNLLIVLNIPSVLGYPLYPLGNFQIITAFLLSYLIIKNNIIQTEGKASKISSRYSIFIFFMTVLIVFIYWTTLNNDKGYVQNILHCLVLSVNLFLANYILSFLISRPIANYMDKNYENLVLATLELESIKAKKEESNKEIGIISELQLKINSYTEIEPMLEEISEYLKENFDVDSSWLLLLNKDSNCLETSGVVLSKSDEENHHLYSWAKGLKIPAEPKSGSFYFCMSRKRPFYFKNIKMTNKISDIDREIIQKLSFNSVAHFPININNECIGVFAIVIKNNRLLKNEEIKRINGFVSLVSGSIQRINLIQEAITNKRISWKLADEISAINELNRIITENENIEYIMNSVTGYLNRKLGIKLYYSLYKVDSNKLRAYYYSHSLPYELNSDDFFKLKNNSIDLKKGNSFHSFIFHRRKLVYFKNVRNVKNSFERWVCELMKIKSYISIPLISNENIIGLLNLTNANGETIKLNYEKIKIIEEMSKQISSAMDKSLRYQNYLESKNKTESILRRLKMLNELSLDFNADLNIENIFSKLEAFFKENFKIHQFGLILVELNKKQAKIHSTNIMKVLSPGKKKIINNILINFEENKSAHNLVFKNKKDFLIKTISNERISKSELIFRNEFNINSIYIIPLIIREEVIGFLDIFDKERIELSKEEKINIVEFSNLIASALWNSILISNITKTYDDYKTSQNQLIQSEKMASLGQLISGVAHEINTPLGAIKASIGNINQSIEEIINELPDLLNKVDKSVWFQVNELIAHSKNSKILNTKEQRKAKKELLDFLVKFGVDDSDYIADSLVDIGIFDIKEEHISLWKHKDKNIIINVLYNISGFKHKTDIIDDSISRASKIVHALKNYAHFSDSEEMQLASIEESIETVLTIYQNSFKKGVTITKDYENIDPIYCFPDELNQVWTNLIHNSLQAIEYSGKIEIKINKEPVSNRKNLENLNPSEFQEDIVIQIIDNGPGVSPEVREKIFNPFFTTKKRGEGSGLGLHITNKIIKKHEAEIDLETKPGYTNFIIRIPNRTKALKNMEIVK